MSSPLPVHGDRPAILEADGWRVYVSIHDAEYLRQKAEWKRKKAEAHPDSPTGSAFRFRTVVKDADKWQAEEVAWYAKYGLTPPLPNERPLKDPERFAYRGKKASVIRRYLSEYPEATTEQIMAATGASLGAVRMVRWRLAHASTTKRKRPLEAVWTALSDGLPHTNADLAQRSGISGRYVTVAINRLRQRGYAIAMIYDGTSRQYRLVNR